MLQIIVFQRWPQWHTHTHTHLAFNMFLVQRNWYSSNKEMGTMFSPLYLGRNLGFLQPTEYGRCHAIWLPRFIHLSLSLPSHSYFSFVIPKPSGQSYWNPLTLSQGTPQSSKFMVIYPMLRWNRASILVGGYQEKYSREMAKGISCTGLDYLIQFPLTTQKISFQFHI